MKTIQVRTHSEDLEAIFKMKSFIVDWQQAQQAFISGMAEQFRDWQPVQPRDVSITSSDSLGDVRCECRLFGGECSIVLNPEALQINFRKVIRSAYPTVFEVIQRVKKWFIDNLAKRQELGWHSYSSTGHYEVVGDNVVDSYLEQFIHGGTIAAIKPETGVRCLPTIQIILSDDEESWVLRRSVERSHFHDHGIFVHTFIHLMSPQEPFSAHQWELLGQLNNLANKAVGLTTVENA